MITTLTTFENHGFKRGQTIEISGVTLNGKPASCNGLKKIVNIDNSTTITIQELRFYEKFFYWIRKLYANWQLKKIQKFYDKQVRHYTEFFHNQLRQSFFKQHLN